MSDKTERILIVEDDEDLLAQLADLLENAGYKVDKATTVGEAVKQTKKIFHYLAIIDIKLPDMNGTKLIPKLPSTTPAIRKIILTGYPDMDNAVEALNLGADKYLIKPVAPEQLLKTVKEQLMKREEEAKYSEKKVEEYIKTRTDEIAKKEK